MLQRAQIQDRAMGALMGVALGDALGMPAQTLTRSEIQKHYGTITSFVPPYDDHPVSHGLGTAMVTDDTEQTLLLAQHIIASPDRFDDTCQRQSKNEPKGIAKCCHFGVSEIAA